MRKPPYPDDFQGLGSYSDVSGYNYEAKEAFLRASRKLMSFVTKHLMESGDISAADVSVNKGGIAVSGEVYSYMLAPSGQYGLMVEISQSYTDMERADRVAVMLQYREPNQNSQLRRKESPARNLRKDVGPNVWFRDTINADNLIEFISHHLSIHPSANRQSAA